MEDEEVETVEDIEARVMKRARALAERFQVESDAAKADVVRRIQEAKDRAKAAREARGAQEAREMQEAASQAAPRTAPESAKPSPDILDIPVQETRQDPLSRPFSRGMAPEEFEALVEGMRLEILRLRSLVK